MGRQKAPSPSLSVPNSEPPDPDPSLVTTDNSLQSNLLQIDLQLHKDATNARFEDLQESMEFIKNQQAQLRAELLDELKQMRLGSKMVAGLHTSLPLRIDSMPPSSSTLRSKPTTSVIDARFEDMHESLEFVKNQQANLGAELPDEFKQFRLGSKTVAGHDFSLPLLIDPIPSSSSTIRSRITTSATGESIIATEEFSMGEAPTFFGDELQKGYPNGFDLKSKGSETSVVVGNRTYVIGGACEESALSIGVRIFDQTSGEWINPTVLGTKPKSYKGHSVVLLSGDQILIVKSGSNSDDFAWFLAVDTQYVRQQKKILGTEVVAWSKGVRGSAEKPVVISGPSGVGKGTLISMLMKEYPSMFGFSVSHTTRAPRAMEKDGVHYHFIERSAMEKEIEDGKFLEFASVHGNLYGTSVEAVEVVADAGKICILDIDVQGARLVRDSSLEALFIFVCPPSMEELEKRLRARGTETEEQVLKRLRNAKAEIEQGQSSGIFDHMLYNDNLEDCYKSLKELLGLDGSVAAPKSSSKVVDLPMDHSISKIDNKIIISSRIPELAKTSTNMFVLNVSSLKGGAPGRTRGLNIYTMDSFLDGLAGITQ